MSLPLTLLQAAESIRKKSVSPVELTEQCLSLINRLNPSLNAFVTVTEESAQTEARRCEQEIRRGEWRGPLHGIPIGLKDLIDTAGIRTTAASALFEDRVPHEDADVVARLKAAGAVILGKQNLHEFAYGGSSVVSHFGLVKNARNPEHIAGGSSGGSATAVAAGMCFAAIGTDTAGSIREPAALCGVVGLKPTYGKVSTRGVIPLSPSNDHVGPITRSVGDAAAVLRALAARQGAPDRMLEILDIRLGVPRKFFFETVDPEVEAAVEAALSVLRPMVKEMRELDLAVPTDRTLQSAEAWAYHAGWLEKNPELYQPETRQRIETGRNITREQLETLKKDLARQREDILRVFDAVDVLVTPTTPIAAPRLSELMLDPKQLRPQELLLLRNTRPFSVWGLPTISIPCGCTRLGLPIGLQIAGSSGNEDVVLGVARAYERACRG